VAVKVRIVGSGEESTLLAERIAALNLTGIVELAGEKSQQALREDFRWAHVLAVPSVSTPEGDIDGVPVVILEAMAMGVPVIASRLSGIPEVVLPGETGVLVDPGDAVVLAQALRQARPPALNELALAARKQLEAKYDLTRSCRRLLRLMQKAARRASP